MEIEIWIAVGAVVLPAIGWGIKRYLTIMADGKITLTEGLETIVDGVEVIETTVDEVEKVLEKNE